MLLKIWKISKISIFWTFWKKNWLRLTSWALFILKLYKAFQTALCKKPWVNFDLNFSFKFLYNFTGHLKKWKIVMVMVKSFDKYHHLFKLHILVTILLFHDWDSSILNVKVIYTNLSIAFKTALIFFASAVMRLKHLPTTYFTILPIQRKEWPFWTKSKVSKCSILEFSNAVVTKILLFGDNTLSDSSNTLILNSAIDYIISIKDLMTPF